MRVLVTGGDGFVGRHLCAELTDRNHDVVSLSRDPDPSVLPDDVETVRGDVTDPDSLDGAFEDVNGVVNLVALSPLFTPSGGDRMHERIHLGGTENVVTAAEEAGVDRILQMSALGADPNGPTHYIRAKGRAEEVVRESDLEWTIVRPSVIFGEGGEFVSFTKRLKKLFAPGVPIYPLPGGGTHTRFQPIWVGDLAPMLADAVVDEAHAGETYELGGPEVLTLREITELVYESEGRSIKIVNLPMGLAGIGLKTLGVVPGFPMGADQYRSLQFDNTTDDNDLDAFGIDPGALTTFAEYLESD
ncbi:complex I NDUFA9 subunit family protein [Halapricum hydrolyticum]|uniref:Complex I NDUFA9 subunit family protein n=1 Tax=Halapricum hydrolyticum TaxID=2979991 RepID=A0AAE3LHJ6_9EURY|nr:complex I NDUFA9 subunit family protein [Halapricum hydrolyticum]MCU4717780.1 complex I NDUFA9 subunit family protein [Halapricum hydrolyticum]MCU4726944.1 complex I NDUFA9 subunit family protein [Halapricum hydrolyticum]